MKTAILWTDQASAQYAKLRAYALAAVGANREAGAFSPQMNVFKDILPCVGMLAANPQPADLHKIAIDGIENPYDATAKVFESRSQKDAADTCRIFWCEGPTKDQITLLTITTQG
ncbi:MAG TPA: hypothetical protein VL282_07355 [Tepidisphaeraceae bacterium]|jgi:hypothetical protein|nr:hypothetical protein [Tepidisphaeraceae bacterium]